MPGFDRTGQEGKGSQTGRELGKCNPKKENTGSVDLENDNKGFGRRLGRGFGRLFGIGKRRGSGRRF